MSTADNGRMASQNAGSYSILDVRTCLKRFPQSCPGHQGFQNYFGFALMQTTSLSPVNKQDSLYVSYIGLLLIWIEIGFSMQSCLPHLLQGKTPSKSATIYSSIAYIYFKRSTSAKKKKRYLTVLKKTLRKI